ncbi:MAG: radical SAM protein [Oscillospiraceae bacterium]|nr:radical SAM protein [Oscillospiraceae bacterium]
MKKFRKIYLEITNQCNLSCSFCPKTKRLSHFMTVEEFNHIATNVASHGENFYFHVMGEPTAHPHFADFLKICSEKGMRVNITTNGTLLDRVGDAIIANKVRSVSVSMHSFEANVLNKDMIDYLDKIMTFCKKSIGSGVTVELRLWNFDRESIYDKNKLNGQIVDYLEKQLKLDFDLRTAMADKFDEMETSNSRKFNFRLKDRVFLGMAQHFEWPDIDKTEKYTEGFCYGLRNQIAVLADGTVTACCLDSEGNIPLGNIHHNTLQEIFDSDRAQALYTGFTHRKAVEPLCQTCGYMKMYDNKK